MNVGRHLKDVGVKMKNKLLYLLGLIVISLACFAADEDFQFGFEIPEHIERKYEKEIFSGDKVIFYEKELSIIYLMEYEETLSTAEGAIRKHKVLDMRQVDPQVYKDRFVGQGFHVAQGDFEAAVDNLAKNGGLKLSSKSFLNSIKKGVGKYHDKAASAAVHSATNYVLRRIVVEAAVDKEKMQELVDELNSTQEDYQRVALDNLLLDLSFDALVNSLDEESNRFTSSPEVKGESSSSSRPKILSSNKSFAKEANVINVKIEQSFRDKIINESQMDYSYFMVSEADKAEIAGNEDQAYRYLDIVREGLDVAAGVFPATAFATDLYALVTGSSLVTGNKIGKVERLLSGVGVLSLGSFGGIRQAYKIAKGLVRNYAKYKNIVQKESLEILYTMKQLAKYNRWGAKNTKIALYGIKGVQLDYSKVRKILKNTYSVRKKEFISFKPGQMLSHFEKHKSQVSIALGRKIYGIEDYASDAAHIVKYGTYLPEANAYTKLIGAKADKTVPNSNFGFVGLNNDGQITTFHIKTRKDLKRKFPDIEIN